jgi:hypothetical protein
MEEANSGEECKVVRSQLESLLDQSDLIWRQRAKIEWMWGGDRNTKFYHACLILEDGPIIFPIFSDVDGQDFNSITEVQLAFVNYFKSLFTSDNAGDMTLCLQPLNC